MMLTRAITGFFFIAVLIGALLLGEYSFVAFFSFVGIWSMYEFYGIVRSDQVQPNVVLGLSAAVTLSASIGAYFLLDTPLQFIFLTVPFVSFIFIRSLFQKRALPFHDLAYTFAGVIYACVPFLFFVALGFIQGTYNFQIPLGFMVILWANDTGAYLSGRALGKRKLFERISPNKTWEGFIGGVLFAIAFAMGLAYYFDSLPTWQWATVALLIAVFGTLGDLVESMLKRSLGVKDSGHILPGHGGLLDRFDGLLVAAPLVYVFLILVQCYGN
ncbi:phosphatidate cytidylyltransferase [Sphingobacterium sp. Mn56C]|uniref:phosphatidate cytidylyltransferase n=1 Tax=Sphingobacterium sp. Mn56C TaxID=3395261 RepID=UPI003BDB01C5